LKYIFVVNKIACRPFLNRDRNASITIGYFVGPSGIGGGREPLREGMFLSDGKNANKETFFTYSYINQPPN